MAQRFKAKTLLSNSGVFNNEVIAPNLVYNTGNQTIGGLKTFSNGVISSVGITGTNLVYNTGDQTIAGLKTFSSGIVSNVGVTGTNLVYNTGNQTISGSKSFINRIYLNNENDVAVGGTYLEGNISGISLKTFQQPTDIKIISDFVGGNNEEVISIRNSYYTDPIFGPSINTAGFGDQIVIYQTGSSYGTLSSKGPYLRLGENNIISEKSTSKLGIGTLFPTEKVHVSGGNLKIEGNVIANNLVYNTGTQTISGVKTFATGIVVSGNLQVSGTGIFNAIDLNSIDNLTLSGVDITITSGVVTLTNAPILSGNPLITGNLSLYATTSNLISTGSRIDTLSGNLITTGSRIDTLSGQVVFITGGNQTISGVKTFANSGVFSLSGISPLNVANNPLSIVGSGNSYIQLNIQNRATGTTATADLVITANNGTDTTNYINLGINNSGYNDSTFSNGSGLDGYLFINGGDLDIGTQTVGRSIEFHAGGTTANKAIARINESGFNLVSGNVTYPVYSGATGLIFIPDASTSTFFDYTLTGNSTLNQPINMNNGQSITLFLNQDASGNRNMSFNSGYLFSNGINPTLNLVPSGTDIMQVIKTRNKLYCTFASNY